MILDKRKAFFAFFIYFVVTGIICLLLRISESYVIIFLQSFIIASIGSVIYTLQHRRGDGFEK